MGSAGAVVRRRAAFCGKAYKDVWRSFTKRSDADVEVQAIVGRRIDQGNMNLARALRDADLPAISRLEPAQACEQAGSTANGLTRLEAEARLENFGPNVVSRERKATVLQELWGRLRNPLNGLLLTLAVVSWFLGDVRAAVVIVAMVVLAVAPPSSRSIARTKRQPASAPWSTPGPAFGARQARPTIRLRRSRSNASCPATWSNSRRRHDPGRRPADHLQGPVRHPGQPDRRGVPGREVRHAAASPADRPWN